jgi:hypothetical protein
MRIAQVPQAVHWEAEPGSVTVLLRQDSGTHLPWLEVALALFLLLALGEGQLAAQSLLVPAIVVSVVVVAIGWAHERRVSSGRPVRVRLDRDRAQATITATDGKQTVRDLAPPGWAHAVRLKSPMRAAFATGWERPDAGWLLVRHKNRSEATNFLRDLERTGWPVHRDEVTLS